MFAEAIAELGWEELFDVMEFLLIAALIVWVVRSIGMWRTLKALGSEHPLAGWVPFACFFALSRAVRESDGKYRLFGKEMPAWIPACWPAWSVGLAFIPAAGRLLGMACQVLFLGSALSKAYARMEGREGKHPWVSLLGYVSSAIGVIYIVKFLIYAGRGKKPAGGD